MRMVMEGLKGFYSNNVSRWLLTLGALVVAMMMTEPSRAQNATPPLAGNGPSRELRGHVWRSRHLRPAER